MISPRSHFGVRHGLSLLEVLVALSIFLFSFIILGRLIIFGSDRALDAQQQGQAAQLCQTKLAEIVAGAVPLVTQSAVPFSEDANWQWSLDCNRSNYPGLWNVIVRVSRQRRQGPRVICSVSQMVLDPGVHGNVLDTPADVTAGDSSNTGSSPSSSGGGGSPGKSGGPSSSGGTPGAGAAGGGS